MTRFLRGIIASIWLLGSAAAVHAAAPPAATAQTRTAPGTAARGYPPFGFPCLGCYPCPPDYCDLDSLPFSAARSAQRPRRVVGRIAESRARVFAWPDNQVPPVTALMICQNQPNGGGICHDNQTGHGMAWGPSGVVTATW